VPETASLTGGASARRWPVRRWIALVALLGGEGLGLGVAFDSAGAARLARGWWTPILGRAGAVMPAAIALAAALVLVASARSARGGAEPPDDSPRRPIPYLLVHLAAFAALAALTGALFGGEAAARDPGPLVAGWLAAVVATLGAWLGAMAPPRFLLSLARARLALLVGAVALGALAFAVGRLTQGLWLPLRRITFAATSAALRATLPGTISEPESFTLGTETFSVEIAPQCSGYEGVGLTWAFVLGALWLHRDRFRFPRAFVLLAIGTALSLAANVARLVALVVIGTKLSEEVALGGFHSYAGSLLFCAVALGVVAGGLRVPWLARPRPDAAAASAPADAVSPAPYLVPFLAMTTAGLVSGAFSTGATEPLYLLRPLAALAALAAFWRSYRAMPLRASLRISWPAVPGGLALAGAWALYARLALGAGAAAQAHAPGAARIATSLVLAPVVEELAFRGFLARRVTSADFERVAPARIGAAGLAVSALAFGLLHPHPVPAVGAGLVYGLLYRRRGNLGDAIAAHATANAALLAAAALTGAWALWW
jgi:exosortase E/protease (VPEID-CTERM system)